jgi:DMSO/TMAO reductase YedYZ heme-binding membrane subunit
MEKKILQYSYWLGVACVVVAVVWRAAGATGYFGESLQQVLTLTYNSFLKGALVFLLTAVATGAYQAGNKQ